ncbi:MAG TPA: hypothetical protein VM013_09425, partial [Dehalococcoidia bacterium]|nr:hypothetical protein [Dehalococcoidia bacterium]
MEDIGFIEPQVRAGCGTCGIPLDYSLSSPVRLCRPSRYSAQRQKDHPLEKASAVAMEELSSAERLARGLRRHSRALVQTAALAAAVVMGIHGSLIINEPSMRRFDEALVWYGFA